MSETLSLPFKPEVTAWPQAPIYTGELNPEFERQLIDAKIITGNDTAEFNAAMQKVRERVTHDNIVGLLKRFSYRLYKANPIDDHWANQGDAGAECFTVGTGISVRRSYAHPFPPSSANDLVLAMDDQNAITPYSLLTTHAALFFLGNFNNIGRSIYELNFNEDTLNLHILGTGFPKQYGDRQYISQRHAEHFFDWHRAVAAGKPFEYTPEDISVGPYVLFEYVTSKETNFVQYYDKQQRFKFHTQVYHPDKYKSDTPEQLAKRLGYNRLYVCDVIVPKGQLVKAWADVGSRNEFTYTVNVTQDLTFPNDRRLVPPDVTWQPNQKERYDKADAIYSSGHFSYQGILDLYDPKQDSEHPWWNVLMGLAYANPRDAFYDEKKSYDFSVRAHQLGNATGAYNLGVHWRDGYYGRIDIEKAKLWYTRALEGDEGVGGVGLFDILKKDPRYKDKENPEFKNAADAIFVRARNLGAEWVRFRDAQCEMIGQFGNPNPARGFEVYEKLADTTPVTSRPPVYAMYNLALRYYLGLDAPRDIQKALSYLDKIPKDKGDNIVPPGTKNAADRLRYLIDAELNPKAAQPYRDPVVMDTQKLADEAKAATQPAPASTQPAPNPTQKPAAVPTPAPGGGTGCAIIALAGLSALSAVVAGGLYLGGFFAQPKQANAENSVANAFVAAKQINIRTSARAERDNIIGQLACGNGVHTLNGIDRDWTEIVLPDRTHAFVASRFLSNNQPSAQQCQP